MSVGAWGLAAGPFRPWRLFAVFAGKADAKGQAGGRTQAAAPDPAEERRFRELMLPHLDAAYTLARYLLRDAAAAEDVTQEAYLRAFRAFSGFRGGEPRAWLLAIVRNCAFTWRKSERSHGSQNLAFGSGDGPDPLDVADPAQESAEAALVRQGEIAAVRAAIAALPEPFRETLVLRELEELSYKEIAAVTAAPVGTVMSRLARARALLAEALAGGGAEP